MAGPLQLQSNYLAGKRADLQCKDTDTYQQRGSVCDAPLYTDSTIVKEITPSLTRETHFDKDTISREIRILSIHITSKLYEKKKQ